MDKKTNAKVINNMAEKIEALETNIKELEQKANRTGQFHLDAINERISKLEKINLLNADRNIKNMEHFEKIVDKIEVLENNLITGVSTLKSHVADSEIKIEDSIDKLNERCDILTKCDTKIIDCLDDIDDKFDDVEAKNFVVKRDIDTINEEHEMFLRQLENKFITAVIERKYNNNEGGNNE